MLNGAGTNASWLLARSRPVVGEPLPEHHHRVARAVAGLPPAWRPMPGFADALPEIGDELSTTAELGILPSALARLTYVYRSGQYLRDAAEFDDVLSMRSELDLDAYLQWAHVVAPTWISALPAYRAAIFTDIDLALDDWDRAGSRGAETGRDEDGRDSVFRIWPVSFWDRELCRRAWGLSPERIATALAPLVQETQLIADGILVITSDRIPTRDEVIATSDLLLAVLAEAKG